jgi:glycosyltransferase involved in cell wall biosynthesis
MKNAKLKQDKSNRILIIHSDGNTYNNPSLKCIIDLLLDNGYTIDLRYPSSFAPMPSVNNVRLIPFGRFVGRLKRIVYNRLCSVVLMYLAVFFENLVYYRNYDLIIGVDRQGLLEANILNRLKRTPFIYISFEMTFEDETSLHFKTPERIASKNISWWIVQDDVRASELKREIGLIDSNKMLLPLASAGRGNKSQARLRDLLTIPEDKNVAIVIGSISKWSMTREIVRSVNNWPEDWVLILHERYGRTSHTLAEEFGDLEHLVGQQIFISDSASEMVDDMSMILSGIDAGLAFYSPSYGGDAHAGKNLKFLGLASGKISTYLRYGVPVIANEIGLYAEEIRKNNLGVVVNGPDELPDALMAMGNEDYSQNIIRYYSEFLDFDIYADKLLSTVKSVIASH